MTFPNFPAAGGVLYCNATYHDQAYFLSVIQKSYPASYLAPMQQNPNSGYEIFQADSSIMARVSLAIKRMECGSFIIFAAGGTRAVGVVDFSRPTATGGAVTILAGTVVTTSVGGLDFVLKNDVVFGALDLGPFPGEIEAITTGYEWNVSGDRLTATGVVIPGAIDTIKLLYTDPAYGDITFTVAQPTATSGGQAPALDGLGEDRGLPRDPNEPDDHYRLRLQTLPDTISPDAIQRVVSQIVLPYNIRFDFIETYSITYETCWDAPSPNAGTPTYQAVAPTNPLYNSNLFVYDDPRPDYPVQNLWMDDQELRGVFIIVLEVATLFDVGMAFDDPGMIASDFRNPATGRQRGTPAFDSPVGVADIYPGAFDGQDLAYNAMTQGLYFKLQQIKAAGTGAVVMRRVFI